MEKVEGKDKLYNTTAFFDPRGDIIGRYRKIHLFDVDIAGGPVIAESQVFDPGNQIIVCPTSVGIIGLRICYDLRFCEICRILALKGAQMIFVPSVVTRTTGKDHWKPLLRARAIENQFFVLAPA